MCSKVAIKVEGIEKCYQLYDSPENRLKQSIYPKIQKIIGANPRKYYREFWALRDISFEIYKGETVGIIGRNGSGKSTLLQIICGTLNPSSGQVKAAGRVAALLELGSGFNPEFTGRENVYLNASILGLSKEEIDLRYEKILDFADIGDFINQATKTYSSGMLLRLAFSVIAHVDADVLIIDEALAVGDAFFTQKCMRFLRNFMQNGTVLFVSHDTASVKNLCGRAIWLDKGSIIQEGTPKDVCESYLQAFYEEYQGKSLASKMGHQAINEPKLIYKDQRQDFINATNVRNDIRVFEFDPNANSFGLGGATIQSVALMNETEDCLNWIVGGENVLLNVVAQVKTKLKSPIIGFHLKDRLGQLLLGDNTYLSYIDTPLEVSEGEYLVAKFFFQMPRLALGEYSISVAIADGSQESHVQHHWIHDAIFFKSESTSVANGIIGIPMHKITLQRK